MEITKEKYQNIVGMLRSPDEENKNVALTIIDQLDFEDNITKILLMKKHSDSNNKLWEAHAPKVFAKLKQISNLDMEKHLTYKNVLSAITQLKVPAEAFEFYMRDFSDYLLTQVKHMGYDYIESMEITVKYKEHEEQSPELSESE